MTMMNGRRRLKSEISLIQHLNVQNSMDFLGGHLNERDSIDFLGLRSECTFTPIDCVALVHWVHVLGRSVTT